MKVPQRTVMQLSEYPIEIQRAVQEIKSLDDSTWGPDFFLWSQGSPEKLTSLPASMPVSTFWCEVLSHCDFDLFNQYYKKEHKEVIIEGQKFMI